MKSAPWIQLSLPVPALGMDGAETCHFAPRHLSSASVRALVEAGRFPASCPRSQCARRLTARGWGSGVPLAVGPSPTAPHPHAKHSEIQGAHITKIQACWLAIILIFIHKHIILEDPQLFLSISSPTETPLTKRIVIF